MNSDRNFSLGLGSDHGADRNLDDKNDPNLESSIGKKVFRTRLQHLLRDEMPESQAIQSIEFILRHQLGKGRSEANYTLIPTVLKS